MKSFIFFLLKLLFIISVSITIVSCGGGDVRQNPHNETFIPDDEDGQNVSDSETLTTNNEVEQETSTDTEDVIAERNYICSVPEDAVLSTEPSPKLITVGAQGNMLISNDGQNWVFQDSSTEENINAIVRGRNYFIAVGDNALVQCSPNGYDWFPIKLTYEDESDEDVVVDETVDLYDVATNGNQFLIVGQEGRLYTNTSNTKWERIEQGQISANLYAATWGLGQFVVVGGDADTKLEHNIIRSPNGIDWAQPELSSADIGLHKVIWTGNQFVAAGRGVTPPEEEEDRCEENCLTDLILYVSNDGYNWTQHRPTVSDDMIDSSISSVLGDENYVVALGHGFNTTGLEPTRTFALTLEYDSGPWVEQDIFDTFPRTYVASILDGSDAYLLSSNESDTDLSVVNNRDYQNPVTVQTTNTRLNDVALGHEYPADAMCPLPLLKKDARDDSPFYFGELYVVVGDEGSIYVSRKGEKWDRVLSGLEVDINDVVRGKGSFYAVADNGKIICSRNGYDWRQLTSGIAEAETVDKYININSIATNGEMYVAVGDDGNILSTVNGIQWDNESDLDDFNFDIKKVIWENNQYVAFGGNLDSNQNSFIITSDNGTNWSEANIVLLESESGDPYIHDITWNGSEYLAVGFVADCSGSSCVKHNLILESIDGNSWQQQEIPTNRDRYSQGTEFTRVATRGREKIALGIGSFSGSEQALTIAANNQVDPWKARDFSAAATSAYNDIFSFQGRYWLVGEGGVIATTEAGLDAIDVSIIGDIDINAIAFNPPEPTTVLVNEFLVYTPVTRDPEGQRLIFTQTGKPQWLKFDRNTGMIYGTPTLEDLTAQEESENDPAPMRITVTQDTQQPLISRSDEISISIVENNPPVILGTPDTEVSALLNESFEFVPIAYDVDFDTLTFSVSITDENGDDFLDDTSDDWLFFDSTTGVLDGKPSATDVGKYTIIISVSDGKETVQLPAFILDVVNLPTNISF